MCETTIASLERFLIHLGFSVSRVEGSHVLFEHAGANARIVLRLYKPDDDVEPAALAYVRRTLDEWGILNREQFDDQLRQRSLAG
jgi:predicted RNA binding protein YcfA (HicA-like mRNA interferase family)